MKNIFKYFFGILATGFLFSACETTELDIRDNPNALTPEQADVNFFINAIQIDYVELTQSLGSTAAEPVRINYMFGRQYVDNYSPEGFNGVWAQAFQGIMADIKAMTPLAEEAKQFKTIGIAQVLQADVLVSLVDFFGDIPFSEALKGSEGQFNPPVDPGASVYAAALGLLDEAINNFTRTDAVGTPSIDFYYNKNFTKWVKLANTIKMKIFLQSRLVDSDALNKFQTIVNSGNFISSTVDDFQFRYGINAIQPDTRHPAYAANYRPTGGGDYMSNWMMNLMQNSNDPRIRFYYYRQTDKTPGQDGVPPNEETISCSLEVPPQHYIDGGFTFCGLSNGYWGRDHGDDDGIPPDGFLRTAFGVYPAGGLFDSGTFVKIGQDKGGRGAGITPIMLASWVDFMRAEAALLNNQLPQAKSFILSGIDKSIKKVATFGSLDPTANSNLFPTNGDVSDFEDSVGSSFDAGATSDKWNILAEQYFVSCFGNGLGAFDFYRRTGFPNTLQPNREPNPGGFVRSFRYPSGLTNNNSSVEQRQNVTTQVFWDTNPASPGFPISN